MKKEKEIKKIIKKIKEDAWHELLYFLWDNVTLTDEVYVVLRRFFKKKCVNFYDFHF